MAKIMNSFFTLSNKCDPELFQKKWTDQFEISLTRIGKMIEDLDQNNHPQRIIDLDNGHELDKTGIYP